LTKYLALLVSLLLSISCHAAPPPPKVLSDKEVYQIGTKSLVNIIVLSKDSVAVGSGSIIGVQKDGHQLVLTCAHLFESSGDRILVRASMDVPWDTYVPSTIGEVVGMDAREDLAIVRLSRYLPRVTLQLGEAATPTDPLFYFGNADEAPMTFGKGVFTRAYYPGEERNYAQFTGLAWPGMSGGPMLDEHGQLVGVLVAVNRVDDPEDDKRHVLVPSIGYFTNQPAVKSFLKKYGIK
jgi:S1-C subfamily serine protease